MRTNQKVKRKRPNKHILEKPTKRTKKSTTVSMNKRKKLAGVKNAANNFASRELHLSEESSDDGTC